MGVVLLQLLCYLEGVRVVLEVWVRVNVGPKGSQPSHCPWLTTEELGGLCLAWETCVATVTASVQTDKDTNEEEMEGLDKVTSLNPHLRRRQVTRGAAIICLLFIAELISL